MHRKPKILLSRVLHILCVISFVQIMILWVIGMIGEFVGLGVLERFFLEWNMTFRLGVFYGIGIVSFVVFILSGFFLKRLDH